MSLFAIADTHLSFGTDKPMDIFRGWSDYAQRLERNWKSVVTEKDTVVIPGDISWAMSFQQARADFEFLHNLPGQKIILKGNHDYWWNTKKKMDLFLQSEGFDTIKILHNNTYTVDRFALCGSRGWFYDAQGEQDVKVLLREAARLERSIEEGKKTGLEIIVFLHYPPIMSGEVCEEIINVLKRHDVKRCYYGHLHGESIKRSVTDVVDDIRFSLVSADFLEFCPRLVEKF